MGGCMVIVLFDRFLLIQLLVLFEILIFRFGVVNVFSDWFVLLVRCIVRWLDCSLLCILKVCMIIELVCVLIVCRVFLIVQDSCIFLLLLKKWLVLWMIFVFSVLGMVLCGFEWLQMILFDLLIVISSGFRFRLFSDLLFWLICVSRFVWLIILFRLCVLMFVRILCILVVQKVIRFIILLVELVNIVCSFLFCVQMFMGQVFDWY